MHATCTDLLSHVNAPTTRCAYWKPPCEIILKYLLSVFVCSNVSHVSHVFRLCYSNFCVIENLCIWSELINSFTWHYFIYCYLLVMSLFFFINLYVKMIVSVLFWCIVCFHVSYFEQFIIFFFQRLFLHDLKCLLYKFRYLHVASLQIPCKITFNGVWEFTQPCG